MNRPQFQPAGARGSEGYDPPFWAMVTTVDEGTGEADWVEMQDSSDGFYVMPGGRYGNFSTSGVNPLVSIGPAVEPQDATTNSNTTVDVADTTRYAVGDSVSSVDVVLVDGVTASVIPSGSTITAINPGVSVTISLAALASISLTLLAVRKGNVPMVGGVYQVVKSYLDPDYDWVYRITDFSTITPPVITIESTDDSIFVGGGGPYIYDLSVNPASGGNPGGVSLSPQQMGRGNKEFLDGITVDTSALFYMHGLTPFTINDTGGILFITSSGFETTTTHYDFLTGTPGSITTSIAGSTGYSIPDPPNYLGMSFLAGWCIDIDLANVISVSNGGTGLPTIPTNEFLFGNGTGAANTIGIGNDQILIGTAGAPTTLTFASGVSNLLGSFTPANFSAALTGPVQAVVGGLGADASGWPTGTTPQSDGSGVFLEQRNNLSGSGAPSAGDDSTQGYLKGSLWIG